MEEVIRLKCPFDGKVLMVKRFPGIESKLLVCPVCKNKFPFSQFQFLGVVTPGGARPGYSEDERTSYEDSSCPGASEMNFILGELKVKGTGETYTLRPGRNVIGRRASKSSADFGIDTGENHRMSREHLVIEVKKVPGKGYVHYASLFKDKVNETLVGREPLLFGDCVVLNHGDVITLPGAVLKFEINDPEGTVM